MTAKIENQALLNGLGHGVLIFSSDNRLVQFNQAAALFLGGDLKTIQAAGWSALSPFFSDKLGESGHDINQLRQEALASDQAIRFRIYHMGQYIPCWLTAINGNDGQIYTMIVIDKTDWSVLTDTFSFFRDEMEKTVDSTAGHLKLIDKTMQNAIENDSDAVQLVRRISGFNHLINLHVTRAGRLMSFLKRLEDIRTGEVYNIATQSSRLIKLEDYLEDFIEALDENAILDPETEKQDIRGRLHTKVSSKLSVYASHRYLTYALHEILRNAIMYSLRGTDININVSARGNNIQIDIIDEGYGIRQNDSEIVFAPYKRAMRPQVISEFGYGLGLHLSRSEIAAMNGRLWFSSKDNVGTTFHIWLPSQPSASSKKSN
ncbi:hypothetical protein MASR2M15_03950 [Anaerolineales bacterium]